MPDRTPKSDASLNCRQCGKPYPKAAQFCNRCGCKVEAASINNRSKSISQPAPGAKPTAVASSGQISQAKIPGPDDFKGSAIASQVLKQTIQHPATIYPLAGSALALSWTLIIAPSVGSIAVGVALAFFGASAFVYNYVVKGPQRAESYVQGLRQARRKNTALSLGNLSLQFESDGCTEGGKEARELKAAYEQLAEFLSTNSQVTSVDRFGVLAEDSLRQGVNTLEQALAIHKAIKSLDVAVLERERGWWQAELDKADHSSADGKALQQQIDSHTRTINAYKQSEDRLVQLLAESNEIESAMRSTYLELVDLGSHDLNDYLRQDGGASNRLNQAVEAARRVEDRLRGDDKEGEERRDKYIQVTKEAQTPQS
jgi:hypothetical protein